MYRGFREENKWLRPHPLCDKLQYIAADYQQYGGSKSHVFDLTVQSIKILI